MMPTMHAGYAQQYESLWRHHWWWRSREKFVATHLARIARDQPAASRRILDIGCGNGLFFETLQTFGTVWGIEPDASLVTDSPRRPQIAVRGFDATYQPPDAKPFNWVLMLDVLEHIQDDIAAARHVREILAPGGTFLLTVPALQLLWSQHDIANHHFRRYTRASLHQVLSRAGFDVLSIRYFFGWTLGPMLLRRLLRPPQKNPGNYNVPIPPSPINATMYTLSRLEQTLLTANGTWGLPLGSSLIAIARRH